MIGELTFVNVYTVLHIYITIIIVKINNLSVFYLKHNVSETGLCLQLQAEPTQLGITEIVCFGRQNY
jgi:hypothetical protein